MLEFPDEDLPDDLRGGVRDLVDEIWPAVDQRRRPLHDPALLPWWMLVTDEATGELLASLAILTKVIDHAGHRFRASGLSAVVVRTDRQGRGHGRRLVAAARERMAGNGTDVGLFTCDRPLQGFYEGVGWQHLPGTVLEGGTSAEPFPSDHPGFDKVTLGDFFSSPARAHRNDFVGARIGLYPGTIDRLW